MKTPSGRLVIALGDPAGSVREVTLKALAGPRASGREVVLVGCRRWLRECHGLLARSSRDPLADPADLPVVDIPLEQPVVPGVSDPAAGAASFAWLTRAAELVLPARPQGPGDRTDRQGELERGGPCLSGPDGTVGRAEWGDRPPRCCSRPGPPAGAGASTPCWSPPTFRSRKCPDQLGPELVSRRLDTLLAFCRRFAPRPRLVVAGLNPHAGEAGQLGREERDWLVPTLERWRARQQGVRLEGPMPPDTCWMEAATAWHGKTPGPDGYLALYHDQGLIPVKLLAFDAAVNTTLGLPFLRTSPDHGTAFEIAGRGVARPDSMGAALETARELGLKGGQLPGLMRINT